MDELLDERTLIVIDEQGVEHAMEILFTFHDDSRNKDYVLYIDPEDMEGEVFVSRFTDDGFLEDIEDDTEWEMIEEVFNAFVFQNEDEEEHDEETLH